VKLTHITDTNAEECLKTTESSMFSYINIFLLLRPRERLRSIVVRMSVCLSDSISPEPHARSLPSFVHTAYVRCSVIRHVDDRPHRLSAGRVLRESTARAKCNQRLPSHFVYFVYHLLVKIKIIITTMVITIRRSSVLRYCSETRDSDDSSSN